MVGKTLSQITIDDMRPEDVPEVLAVENVSFTTPWSETLFMNEIYKPGSLPQVARHGERVVGYICANRVLDEGHILNVTVHPDRRRQGIASLLISSMIRMLRESACKAIYLEVRTSNEAARKMYEQSGFRVIGTRKNYYTSPAEDALMMALHMMD
jgi:ribosomal-protein-alanine N-acetyltransferase